MLSAKQQVWLLGMGGLKAAEWSESSNLLTWGGYSVVLVRTAVPGSGSLQSPLPWSSVSAVRCSEPVAGSKKPG